MGGIPNLLTMGRVGAVPLIVALFYIPGPVAQWAAFAVFFVAAATDHVDGYLARSWNQQSDFGRWLDPVADKLLVGAVVVMLVGFDRAPLLPAVIIILREILVSSLREYLAEVGEGMPVTRLAKLKTTFQLVALGFLLVGDAAPYWAYAQEIGTAVLWGAALVTLWTGYVYLATGVRRMMHPRVPPKMVIR